jgi:2-polyprenyl-3-methyl-5-hydroxy-6-metoxy-1,4-benzoquinol methylase
MRFHLDVTLVGGLDTQVLRCARCGFRQIRPRLTPDEVERLYPEAYFDSKSGFGFKDYARQQQRNEREAYFLAKRLRRIAPRGRLLEVGCALGFLIEAVRRFSGWEVGGIDLSTFAVEFARHRYGLAVECKTLDGAAFPDASFDFIVQRSLLEHVTHPREHLRETFRILRPGGQVWIITPNGEANLHPYHAIAARQRRSEQPMLPLLDQGHLQFFSRENLLQLFTEEGFECVWLRNIGIRRGLRSLGYMPLRRGAVKAVRSGRRHAGEAAGLPGESAPLEAAERSRLLERFGAEVDARHSWLRSWPPYFYFRRAMRGFDGLPGGLGLGYDFSCLLRKPSDAARGRTRVDAPARPV